MAKKKIGSSPRMAGTHTMKKKPVKVRPAVVSDPLRVLEVQLDGKPVRWNVPDAAHANKPELRLAFVGGFETRVYQVRDGYKAEQLVAPVRFPEGSAQQQAFADGYHEAARQDGQSLRPRKLSGK